MTATSGIFTWPAGKGLYPGYPKAATTRLILVESIIDAVSLLQQPRSRYNMKYWPCMAPTG
jgi:hypothetical protein